MFSALLPLAGDEKIPPLWYTPLHVSIFLYQQAREKQTATRGTRTNQIRYLNNKEVSPVSFQELCALLPMSWLHAHGYTRVLFSALRRFV
jgi:type VI protein secretion system component VasA